MINLLLERLLTNQKQTRVFSRKNHHMQRIRIETESYHLPRFFRTRLWGNQPWIRISKHLNLTERLIPQPHIFSTPRNKTDTPKYFSRVYKALKTILPQLKSTELTTKLQNPCKITDQSQMLVIAIILEEKKKEKMHKILAAKSC